VSCLATSNHRAGAGTHEHRKEAYPTGLPVPPFRNRELINAIRPRCSEIFSPPSRQPKYATVAKAVFDLWVDNIFAVHRRAAEPIKSTDVNRVS